MDVEPACPRCGAERPANAPAGLCPRCLLRLGLGLEAGPLDPEDDDDAWTSRREPASSRTSGVLQALEVAVGPVPRVLLRDGESGDLQPGREPCEIPTGVAGDPGRYHLSGEIARGGMGIVFKGRDVDLGRDVAVKVLKERYRDNPEMVRRFVEEAQIGGQLQHPGIVPVYELGRLPDSRLYIAMKLVKGRTLAALLGARQGPAEDQARFLAVFEHVCQTIAYAHSRAVIHRDLKPSNVMVGSFGEVQVMDWGLAKVVDQGGVADGERAPRAGDDSGSIRTARDGTGADPSRSGSVVGTPSYMAPEQARGQFDTLDERADVFGLGAILCEILTGQPPYSGPAGGDLHDRAARADLAGALDRLDSCGAERDLVELAKACLAPAPRDRPRDAGVASAALAAHLADVRERIKAAELAQAQAESRAAEERKRRILAVGLAASLIALVGLGVGGGAWLAGDRAARREATTREVATALDAAALRLGRARMAPEADPSWWDEATQASERAEGLAARDEVEPSLRRNVRDLAATIARERGLAEAVSKDRRMVERLGQIHADIAVHLDLKRADAEYAEAFRTFGVDVDRLDPDRAGALLASSPVAPEFANALDHWTFIRKGAQGRDPDAARDLARGEGQRRLIAVAKATDPDPWRNRLRDTLAGADADRSRALDDLRRLAATADPARLPEASVTRLASALSLLGDRELAIRLLLRTQRAHPDDFWVNRDLASQLENSGRAEEAVRFHSAAVAIRPRSEMALRGLGNALRAAGRPDEAAMYRQTNPPPPGPPWRRGPGRPPGNRPGG